MKAKKWIAMLGIILLVSFSVLEIVSRLIVTNKDGKYFVFGKAWRYVLPFNYSSSKPKAKTDKYRIYDDTLGWSMASWEKDSFYYSNDIGCRCSKFDFENKVHALKHYDLVCIGNSFTHGDAVAYEDAWPHLLSLGTGRSVLNMGVGGYGIDQALMRLMNSNVTADTVILGLVAGDMDRATTSVYNYYTGGSKTKPKFKFTNATGNYSLMNVPCITPEEFVQRPATEKAKEVYRNISGHDNFLEKEQKFWANSMFMRIMYSTIHQMKNPASPVYLKADSQFNYCMEIFKLFKSYCESKGIVPLVVLMDNNNSFTDRASLKTNTWTLLKNSLTKENIEFLEFQDRFNEVYQKNNSDIIHPEEKVHYSPKGHSILADLIQNALKGK